MVIDVLELVGVGVLMVLLEECKKKFVVEGLFVEECKKLLLFLLKVIGVVMLLMGVVI